MKKASSEALAKARVTLRVGHVLDVLRDVPDDHVDCVVTSPPYWGLRDYGTGFWEGGKKSCDHSPQRGLQGAEGQRAGRSFTGSKPQGQTCGRCGARRIDLQMGLEPTLGEHISALVAVFDEVRRVLKPTGTLWLNYGDTYAASPNGRSTADTKAAGNDDRAFRDKPFSTIGHIHRPTSVDPFRRDNGRRGGGQNPSGGFLKPKDLCMLPNRVAIAMQDAGWWVRSEIVWSKSNPMPENAKDRPTCAHEKVWLMAKSERYYYDAESVAEPVSGTTHARVSQDLANQIGSLRANGGSRAARAMKAVVKGPKTAAQGSGIRQNESFQTATALDVQTRNMRNVWPIATAAFKDAHFATFPPELARRCILAGCPPGGVVMDPFAGSGTTGMVARRLGRKSLLIELSEEYARMAADRILSDNGA